MSTYAQTRELLSKIAAPADLVELLIAEAEAARRWSFKDDRFHQLGNQAALARESLAKVSRTASALVRFLRNHPRMAQPLLDTALRANLVELRRQHPSRALGLRAHPGSSDSR